MEDTGIVSVIVATLPVERETLAVAEMTLPVSDSMTLEVVTVEFKDEVDILEPAQRQSLDRPRAAAILGGIMPRHLKKGIRYGVNISRNKLRRRVSWHQI